MTRLTSRNLKHGSWSHLGRRARTLRAVLVHRQARLWRGLQGLPMLPLLGLAIGPAGQSSFLRSLVVQQLAVRTSPSQHQPCSSACCVYSCIQVHTSWVRVWSPADASALEQVVLAESRL